MCGCQQLRPLAGAMVSDSEVCLLGCCCSPASCLASCGRHLESVAAPRLHQVQRLQRPVPKVRVLNSAAVVAINSWHGSHSWPWASTAVYNTARNCHYCGGSIVLYSWVRGWASSHTRGTCLRSSASSRASGIIIVVPYFTSLHQRAVQCSVPRVGSDSVPEWRQL